ncbi:MAG: D-glycerate 2-kinase [candidate division WS2 bacterium]|uniref:D-glycerate 2-kinase n=1 Tax=Psychracetigena formicireducens TaxID=2986056 RepID=A0A9E2F1T5_PSYF1|nr:D-glycerate 2-kinase [Candidatus Psychracetigena formicireducens]MBT9145017.1 D-glycerate 2-kinase [Candidatus Psychracetigena formicireducens]
MNYKKVKNIYNLREDAFLILSSIISAIEPGSLVKSFIEGNIYEDINKYSNIIVLGAGKACAPMAKAVEAMFPDKIKDSLIIVPDGYKLPTQFLNIVEAAHPLPDQRGLEATKKIINLIESAKDTDLIIFLFSGGGSALLTCPYPPLTLDNIISITKELIHCGASIEEINTVRKHLSFVQGGRLGKMVKGASITLLLSDVVGNNLSTIASGPTIPDLSTFKEAQEVLDKYHLTSKTPSKIIKFIIEGKNNLFRETPKFLPPKQKNYLVGSNSIPLESAYQTANSLGYNSVILTSTIDGEARIIGKIVAKIGKEIPKSNHPLAPPACILIGGETTVKVIGSGKGGRNQEVALSAGLELELDNNILVLSFSTDGKDGPTDACGAYVDSEIMLRARDLELNGHQFLKENNSYNFFLRAGGLIKTSPTYTNVGDIILVLTG